jgi:hypothetical protein
MYSANWTGREGQQADLEGMDGKRSVLVSPASPEKAIRVCLFKARVLSSEALRMVAPRIAALEAAMRVKSLPVMPSKTSLCTHVD